MTSAFGAIDFPAEGALVAREGFIIQGFAIDARSGRFRRISVQCDGVELASSSIHYRRADVIAAIAGVTDVECGFRVLVGLPSSDREAHRLSVTALFSDGSSWASELTIVTGSADYRSSPYGTLVDPSVDVVYHRNDIYGVGPPSLLPSEECVGLLQALLAEGEAVVDVGCGVGAYAQPLLAAGVAWRGCEINPDFVTEMRRRSLPVVQVTGQQLPFGNCEFESAICIEVLEHILDYEPFLNEISRISRRRAIFSVPNAEAIPIMADRLLVPWHLLEADHKNFFTRTSLRSTLLRFFSRVEIVPYGVMPVASSNGTPVYYHLLAIAEREE